MKKTKNALLLALCAVLLVGATIAGTVAYLTSTTVEVKNTFTAGNVAISLDEAPVDLYGEVVEGDRRIANQYKLIPGHTYTKDPTIHVVAGSEECWVFAKLEDGLGDDSTITIDTEKWEKMNTADGSVVYGYKTKLTAGQDAILFSEFTFGQKADPEDYKNASITIIGYAVQADGFGTVAEAWAAAPATWTAN